jgi:hypothetical protein
MSAYGSDYNESDNYESESDVDYELIDKQYDYSAHYVGQLWTKFVYSPIELLGYEGKGKMVSLRRGYWTDYQWDEKYDCIRSISIKRDLYSLDEEQRTFTPRDSFDFIRFLKLDGASEEFAKIMAEKNIPIELVAHIHSFVNTRYTANLLCVWEKM